MVGRSGVLAAVSAFVWAKITWLKRQGARKSDESFWMWGFGLESIAHRADTTGVAGCCSSLGSEGDMAR
jgi:hypothetical protein